MNFKIISISEPLWLENVMLNLNNFINNNYTLSKIIPISADIFVFTYPIYLVIIYLYGIGKNNDFYKNTALYIFFSGISSVMFNIFIQIFIDKDRPESFIDKSKLLLEHLPDASFPSDHAAMSSAIATSILLAGIKNKNQVLILSGIIFWIFSILMSISRVGAGVHWISDVIFGSLIGIIISVLLYGKKTYIFLETKIFSYIISIEKYIFKIFFGIY